MTAEKKVLITGGTGFVGRHLLEHLEACAVHLALRAEPAPEGDFLKQCAAAQLSPQLHIIGDMAEYDDWHALFEGVDVVIHLAARVHKPGCENEEAYQRENVDVVRRMIAAAVVKDVKRFIFLSSIKVNGESTKGLPFKPYDNPAPRDAYGASKAEAEKLLLDAAENTGLDVVIIRPPLVYGPGVKANFDALWQLAESNYLLPVGAVNNKRDMVSVYNLCDAIVKCISAPQAKNQIFLVSDGQSYSLSQLVATMRQVMGKPKRLVKVPVFIMAFCLCCLGRREVGKKLFANLEVDITHIQKALDWQPVVSLQQTLEKMLELQKESKC